MPLHVGDDHIVSIEIENVKTGHLEDPVAGALRVYVKPERGSARTYQHLADANLVRTDTGRFQLTLDITVAGRWDVVVISPGPVLKGREPYGFSAESTVAP